MDRQELLQRVTVVARDELALPQEVAVTETTKLDEVTRVSSVRLMAFLEAIESEFDIEFDIENLSGDVVTDVSRLLPLIESELA